MGTVNLNTGVSTPAQTDIKAFNQSIINPIQPTNIPNSQNISTFGTQPINLPTQAPIQPTPQLNQAEQILRDTAVADTEAQKSSQNLSKAMLELIPSLQGQTQALGEAQAQVGLPAMRQNLQNINNQILQKQAELNQDEIRLAQSVQNIEDKPIAMEFITGQQQSVARNAQIARALKASEIGVLNATALGMQGNIALAEATAKQAVETKYAPYKEALDTYRLQLEALQPLLTADEKKQAREQEIKTTLAMNEVKKKEKDETDIANMIINASSQGAPQSVIVRAKTAKTPIEVASVLGMYAGDYYGTKLKIAEYNKKISEANGGGISTLPGQSEAESWLTQFNSGAMELNDIYSKIGTSKDAQKIKNEFSKLVAAQGGKRVIPMDDAQIAAIDDQIKNINDLLGENGYNYKVISGLSQGGTLGIGARITGAKGDALAIARNLVSNQTLQALADAKAKGVTFGALSEAELNAVANSASRIASKIVKDKEGNITGFSGSESGFKSDLEKVRTGLINAKAKKTGETNVLSKVDKAVQILNSDTNNNIGGFIFNQ